MPLIYWSMVTVHGALVFVVSALCSRRRFIPSHSSCRCETWKLLFSKKCRDMHLLGAAEISHQCLCPWKTEMNKVSAAWLLVWRPWRVFFCLGESFTNLQHEGENDLHKSVVCHFFTLLVVILVFTSSAQLPLSDINVQLHLLVPAALHSLHIQLLHVKPLLSRM